MKIRGKFITVLSIALLLMGLYFFALRDIYHSNLLDSSSEDTIINAIYKLKSSPSSQNYIRQVSMNINSNSNKVKHAVLSFLGKHCYDSLEVAYPLSRMALDSDRDLSSSAILLLKLNMLTPGNPQSSDVAHADLRVIANMIQSFNISCIEKNYRNCQLLSICLKKVSGNDDFQYDVFTDEEAQIKYEKYNAWMIENMFNFGKLDN